MVPRSLRMSDEAERLRKMAYVMHAVLYGAIYAMADEAGLVDWERIVSGVSRFMRCCKYLKPEYQDADDIVAELEKSGLIRDAHILRDGDKIVVKMEKCPLAGGKEGVHRLLCPVDVPCPIALFIGVNIALKNKPRKLMVHSTVFHEEGSTTEMELLSSHKYAQRKESVRLIKGLTNRSKLNSAKALECC